MICYKNSISSYNMTAPGPVTKLLEYIIKLKFSNNQMLLKLHRFLSILVLFIK